MPLSASPRRVRVDGDDLRRLSEGWQLAPAEPGRQPAAESWIPASVPGTVASALRDAGIDAEELDTRDWWFRTRFDADPVANGEEVVLRLDGIATVSRIELNGELIGQADSMFAALEIDITSRLRATNELVIRCLALAPLLQVSRKPRARWRSRVAAHGNLRWFRTTLLGRAPGFAPGPAAVGPWREVLIHRRRSLSVARLDLRPRLDLSDGILMVRGQLRILRGAAPTSVAVEAIGPTGTHRTMLPARLAGDAVLVEGELRIPGVAAWWPHTHGEPALYRVRLVVHRDGDGDTAIDAGRTGFRTIAPGPDPDHRTEREGLDLHINGIRVFARGAVWTPIDAVGLAPTRDALRSALQVMCEAGMNMVRLPGIGTYEQDDFHALCDELGVLVWQDFMFANLDYPFGDPAFSAAAADEVGEVLDRIGGRPSLAVLCGNSEIEQQVAMLGLDPGLGRGAFFAETLPSLAQAAGVDAIYIPSAPSGGDLPFRPDTGIANYYGVGAYRRPLSDARTSMVRFAAECLAFSNVPDDAALVDLEEAARVVHHPRWKAGVPRDAGSGWDFEDVRDHYLALEFGVDPAELRRVDHARYLELSRAVTGEVMAEVFGEWRRADSPSGGGLVLWLRDLVAGAGWGVLDHRGLPKTAYHHLRRALAPVATWTTDEGLNGIVAHVANDRPRPLSARLRVALYRDLEHRVDEGHATIELPPHGAVARNVEAIIGRFVDAGWAYRFGPPAHDVVVTSLEQDDALLSQSFRFPAGRPMRPEPATALGLRAAVSAQPDGSVRLDVHSRRLAYGVRVHAPGYAADDDAFSIEPGAMRSLLLRPLEPGLAFSAELTALNLTGRISLPRMVS